MNLPEHFGFPSKRRQSEACRMLLAIAFAVVAIQLSGVVQAVVSQCCLSTVDPCAGAQGNDDDKPCHDCSPHCPQCRCTHAAFTSLVATPPLDLGSAVGWQQAEELAFEPGAPPAPPLPSLYHPPRLALLSF